MPALPALFRVVYRCPLSLGYVAVIALLPTCAVLPDSVSHWRHSLAETISGQNATNMQALPQHPPSNTVTDAVMFVQNSCYFTDQDTCWQCAHPANAPDPWCAAPSRGSDACDVLSACLLRLHPTKIWYKDETGNTRALHIYANSTPPWSKTNPDGRTPLTGSSDGAARRKPAQRRRSRSRRRHSRRCRVGARRRPSPRRRTKR